MQSNTCKSIMQSNHAKYEKEYMQVIMTSNIYKVIIMQGNYARKYIQSNICKEVIYVSNYGKKLS